MTSESGRCGLVRLAAICFVAFAACGRSDRSPSPPGAEAEDAARLGAPAEGAEGGSSPLARMVVHVYFPSAAGWGLSGEPREIFETAQAADRAKQILAEILSGPQTESSVPAIPDGTSLRQVYVLEDGTAYVDFSRELRERLGGGSAREILAVYAIVDSLVLNVPEIRRVGILVEGEPCETLNGHLDLRRPFRADPSLIVASVAEPSREGV